jgi:replicative DNA helicase
MQTNFNIQAEQSVIGSIIQDNNSFDLIHTLQASAFYDGTNAEIYRTICQMMAEQKPVDVLTIAEQLEAKGKLAHTGGLPYLIEVAQSIGSSANIKQYASMVQEKATLRNIQTAVSSIQQDLQSAGDISAKLERAQSAIMAITETTQSSDPVFVGDILPERFERYDALMQGLIKTIGTGLKDLDEKIGGGLEAGALVIIAARPAMGKSALAVQIAEHIQNQDAAALIFTCEMPNAQIVDRLISSHSKISSDKLRSGKFDDEDLDRLHVGSQKVKALNLLVDDKAYTINAIASKSRTIKRKHGLSIIVVDYLQLLDGSGESREQIVSAVSRGLKKLAIELQVPVIALSQLNRELEKRANKRPVMSDMRESGAIEQDADLILGLYQDEKYNQDSQDKGTAELEILKNRSGATGRIRLTFMGESVRFGDFSGEHFRPYTPTTKTYNRGFD